MTYKIAATLDLSSKTVHVDVHENLANRYVLSIDVQIPTNYRDVWNKLNTVLRIQDKAHINQITDEICNSLRLL